MNKGTKIFIDTQDMEERYGEELYKEYLEKENKQLKQENEKLKEENFNLREGIYIEKMSFSSEGRNFKELIEMPTYEDLQKENEKLNHYKLLYQKVKERNDKAIEYLEQELEYSKRDCVPARSFTCEKALKILEGNNESK